MNFLEVSSKKFPANLSLTGHWGHGIGGDGWLKVGWFLVDFSSHFFQILGSDEIYIYIYLDTSSLC